MIALFPKFFAVSKSSTTFLLEPPKIVKKKICISVYSMKNAKNVFYLPINLFCNVDAEAFNKTASNCPAQ